jgi:hypothetical protein
MIETLEALIAFLLTKSGVTAQVSTRIYGPPGLPQSYRGETAVLIVETPGEVSLTTPRIAPDVLVHCYGPTAVAARTVYRAVRDALHDAGPVDVTLASGTARLLRAWQVSTPEDLPEPATGWQRCVARFATHWLDRTVT